MFFPFKMIVFYTAETLISTYVKQALLETHTLVLNSYLSTYSVVNKNKFILVLGKYFYLHSHPRFRFQAW